jgi:5'-nucleotidase/UDP-sugar diphosphatase
MKLFSQPLVVRSLVSALALGLVACGGDDNDGEVRDLRSDLNQTQQQLTQTQQQLTDAKTELDSLETQLTILKNPPIVGEPLQMTILHINDHHSHLSAGTFTHNVAALGLATKNAANQPVTSVSVSYGGFPMLASLFDQVAAQSVNPIKIHAGDAITGTLFYSLFNGAADAAMMNQICFDMFALGNHEFDSGDQGLVNFLDDLKSSACRTSVLAANVVPAATSPLKSGYLQPYIVREVQGQKVGFIGIDIADKTKNSSRPDTGTTFLNETTTAQKYIDELRAQGINKIVLVTHYQYDNDKVLASQLSGVDVIVGGDSHTLLGGSTFTALGFNPAGDYPTQVTNKDGEKVCVVQAWEYARVMGKLQVDFDAMGKVSSCTGNAYLPIADQFSYTHATGDVRKLNATDAFKVRQKLTKYPEVVVAVPDASTQNLLDIYNAEVKVLEQLVIGMVAENLCLVRMPGESRSTICPASATSANGSDISNIIAKAFLMITPNADIAIQNGGGVRTDIAAGSITFAQAVNVLPFNNTLVTMRLTGAQIKAVLEDALENSLRVGGSTGAYPYTSGLRYHVNASLTKGSRISNVEVNSRVAGSWAPINDATTYTIVTNDFIAKGQDGYTTLGDQFKAGNFVNTFTLYTQGFIDYIKGLAAQSQSLQKLPISEYSTQQYIGRDGCNHSTQTCTGF